ncbi:hypothetical protein L6452_37077 [Arctium lappa]|uniref:Uncharacterized protein n=1 Tax=Arctium lappa TaxID=4217 RepID=A0ACB8Y206_ARCLA|nr:hypothetical protein L6452_37077 [Arctium lappa]
MKSVPDLRYSEKSYIWKEQERELEHKVASTYVTNIRRLEDENEDMRDDLKKMEDRCEQDAIEFDKVIKDLTRKFADEMKSLQKEMKDLKKEVVTMKGRLVGKKKG